MYGKMKAKRGKKSKQKKDDGIITRYFLDNVKFSAFSKQGYGPKKTECQDSYSVMD
jgi:hypothetical protein